jgi:hypothetical protein
MSNSALRTRILDRLGRFPARVPLAAEFGLALDMGDHTRAPVAYDVESGERVSA